MKCLSCNNTLSDFEATRRYAESKEFVDLCTKCYSTIEDFPRVITRVDLEEEVYDSEE